MTKETKEWNGILWDERKYIRSNAQNAQGKLTTQKQKTKQKNPEGIMLSEINKSQKDK